ncbi:LysR family transcriptional regulator [Pseudomonas coleopterorum]|uniref:LysR family transcriptional regulator n=1 Tax=Pseudomonas coleopterorum TaxID=1605838 RepID=UPI0028A8909C|nr:LysR family transcriptional regulator [Pseudomonas coleopterorum]
MLDLNDMALFVRVVRSGSFAEAGRQLGIASNTISRRIQLLEDQLDTRLFHRSTRKLVLTHAGEALHERCASLVEGLTEAGNELMTGSDEASGLVRVAAPADFFDFFHMDWVADFLAVYPRVKFEFVLSDARADLIAERIDVAFRGGLLTDSGYVGRQILRDGSERLVASPGYLAAHGAPSTLQDLLDHHCLSFARPGGYATWRLDGPESRVEEVRISPRVSGNTAQSLRKAALAGLGIALLPVTITRPDLQKGSLVGVLPQYSCRAYGFNVLYPSRRQLPKAVAAFIDVVIERLGGLED